MGLLDIPSGHLPLHETLPKRLVESIREHLQHRPNDAEDFLSWETDSAVGSDCMKLAFAGLALISQMGDCEDRHGQIATDGVWSAIAHQCVIYAFS